MACTPKPTKRLLPRRHKCMALGARLVGIHLLPLHRSSCLLTPTSAAIGSSKEPKVALGGQVCKAKKSERLIDISYTGMSRDCTAGTLDLLSSQIANIQPCQIKSRPHLSHGLSEVSPPRSEWSPHFPILFVWVLLVGGPPSISRANKLEADKRMLSGDPGAWRAVGFRFGVLGHFCETFVCSAMDSGIHRDQGVFGAPGSGC